MMHNHWLSKSIQDQGWSLFIRQLEYKVKILTKIDQWFASTKTCSNCNNKKDIMPLSERTYICDNCGLIINSDLNAAINILYKGSSTSLKSMRISGIAQSNMEELSPKLLTLGRGR